MEKQLLSAGCGRRNGLLAGKVLGCRQASTGWRDIGWQVARAVVGMVAVAVLAGPSQAQVVATWTGAGNGTHYSDPNNWSTGVVPINGGGTNYNLVVPNSRNIIFDVAGSVSGISYGTGGSITMASGVAFNVDSVASLGSNIFADGAGTSFTANGVGVVLQNNVRSVATNGGQISTSAVNYTRSSTGNLTVFHANGAGSSVNASSMSSIINTVPFGSPGQGGNTTYLAENGGLIDFSNLQSIDGGSTSNNATSRNTFTIRSGGDIKLDSVQTIAQINTFNVEVPTYSLASFTSGNGFNLNLASGSSFNTPTLLSLTGGDTSSASLLSMSSWNAAQMQTLDDTTLTLEVGSSLNSPNLVRFRNSSVILQPGVAFDTGIITDTNNSRLRVNGGYVLDLGIQTFTRSNTGNNTAFHADGFGSSVNALSLNSIINTVPFGSPGQGGTTTYLAENGGVINFSNVQSIDGGSTSNNATSRNTFTIRSGGDIKLDSVQTISQINTFNVEVPTYSLASFTSGNGFNLNLSIGSAFSTPSLISLTGGNTSSATLPVFSSWHVPQLQTLDDTTLTLEVGSSLNSPNLVRFRNSSVILQPGVAFDTGIITDTNNSRLRVNGGYVLDLGIQTFTRSNTGNNTAFHADGFGSSINALSLNSIINTVPFGSPGQGGTTTYLAENGGVINFSNVQSIDGGSSSNNATSRNTFSARSGGQIQFGDVQTVQINTFTVDGPSSVLSFKGLSLGTTQTNFSAANLGTLQVSGSLSHVHTNAANFNFDNGRIAFEGVELAELEIAGRNLGFEVNGLGNFGYQQLAIGGGAGPTTLILTDRVNNGNRLGGLSEVQYLLDVSGDGLVINEGSRLILNGFDMFVSNGENSFFSVRDLFAPGQRTINYSGGQISLTDVAGGVSNGNFEIPRRGLVGWNTNGPGSARIVDAPTSTNGGNRAVELEAGSPIELSQFVSTLNEDFEIIFDARAINTSGQLTLKLDNEVLHSWTWSEIGTGQFSQLSFLVNAGHLLNRTDIPLAFLWDGNAGHKVWLDNVMMVAVVPEPSSILLLLLSSCLACHRRRRT